MLLRTIIVEDEPLSRAFLQNLLSEYCPMIEVLAAVPSENEAVEAIKTLQPDLVFLDIELQQGTGFEVLKKTQPCHYQVIFTTAIEHNGIRAIKFSGVDYLQKPIDIQGLQSCIASVTTKSKNEAAIAVQHLVDTLNNNNLPIDLRIKTATGNEYIPVKQINYIEAVGNDCVISINERKIIAQDASMKEFDQLLEDFDFIRPHHAFIINLDKVSGSSKPETGFISLTNNSVIPVSAKKVAELKQKLSSHFKK